jgi:transcriptional regulator with XRE-family HTH domain
MEYTERQPSEVFAARLKEMRMSRNRTQEELAEKVREAGVPMSKAAVLRIEKGERGISLDEAVAFAGALNAVFASLLSPPEGEVVRVADWLAMDGEAIRTWLRYGLYDWQPAPDEAHEEGRRIASQKRLGKLAEALVEAHRAEDWAAVTYIDGQIQREYERREREESTRAAEVSDAS